MLLKSATAEWNHHFLEIWKHKRSSCLQQHVVVVSCMATNWCYLPISAVWPAEVLVHFLPFNKRSEAERISTKNYIEKQLKNKLVSALISLPLFRVSQFFLSPWFLTSITIHCLLSHFSYKSLLKNFLHEAQKQKSFSAHP